MSVGIPHITEQPEQQADKHISSQLNNTAQACNIHLLRHPALALDIVQKNYAVTCRWHQPLHKRITSSLASITSLCTKEIRLHLPVLPGFAQQIYRAILCQNLTLHNKFASPPTTGTLLCTKKIAPSFANSTTACAIHLPRYSLLAQAFVRQTYKDTWKYRLLKPAQCYINVAHTTNINASQPLQKMQLQPCSQTNKDCRTGIQKTIRRTILLKKAPNRQYVRKVRTKSSLSLHQYFTKPAPSLPNLRTETSR